MREPARKNHPTGFAGLREATRPPTSALATPRTGRLRLVMRAVPSKVSTREPEIKASAHMLQAKTVVLPPASSLACPSGLPAIT